MSYSFYNFVFKLNAVLDLVPLCAMEMADTTATNQFLRAVENVQNAAHSVEQ